MVGLLVFCVCLLRLHRAPFDTSAARRLAIQYVVPGTVLVNVALLPVSLYVLSSLIRHRRRSLSCALLEAALSVVAVVAVLATLQTLRHGNRLLAVEHPDTGYEFPATAQIASIYVRNTGMVTLLDDFQAPPTRWADILHALQPSQYDPQPAAWQALARLEIRTNSGRLICVDVFWVENEPVGAFAVSAPPPEGGGSFRGGNSRRFLRAITAAAADLQHCDRPGGQSSFNSGRSTGVKASAMRIMPRSEGCEPSVAPSLSSPSRCSPST